MRPTLLHRLSTLAAAAALANCATNPVTGNPDFVMLTEWQEIALGRFAEGHLRVLNGLYPAGEPVAGQSLKIVE